jgi:hypothetical protein
MPLNRRRSRPALERLETRQELAVASLAATSGQNTLATLEAFSQAYLSRYGQPNYNPAFDLNHNGQIGQDDARLLIQSLPPLSPKIPLRLSVTLAPQDKARGHVPTNLGGVTHSQDPTVVGRTTPGALVFTGTGTLDAKLRGPVLVADANGNFSEKVHQSDGINQLDFLAIDAYGQQSQFRAFPIYWLGFARFEAAHPRKT